LKDRVRSLRRDIRLAKNATQKGNAAIIGLQEHRQAEKGRRGIQPPWPQIILQTTEDWKGRIEKKQEEGGKNR